MTGKNKHLRKVLNRKHDNTVIASASYELDAAGIRQSMTDKDGGYYKWGYDPMYQLKAEHKWASKGSGTRNWYLDWAYDGNGNRLRQWRDGVQTPYTFGENNEMLTAGGTDFTFDRFGNLVSYDDGTDIFDLSYDFERHMTQMSSMDICLGGYARV